MSGPLSLTRLKAGAKETPVIEASARTLYLRNLFLLSTPTKGSLFVQKCNLEGRKRIA